MKKNKKSVKLSTKPKKIQKTKPTRSTKPSKKQVAVKKQVTKKKKADKLTPKAKKLQDIRKKLLCQKEALLAEAEEALNTLPGQMTFPDMSDQASAETERSFMLRLRSREQKLLKKIEEAIERIDNGTFGICDSCALDIDMRRLEARPVTTLCIDCKTLQEEEEKLREG
ncbi:MAG: RNA polymerase-binding protein DksA [Nitrospirae bacterium]|nr:RNA polymerase-binding protein DksA [Nitrospirota bacterium]